MGQQSPLGCGGAVVIKTTVQRPECNQWRGGGALVHMVLTCTPLVQCARRFKLRRWGHVCYRTLHILPTRRSQTARSPSYTTQCHHRKTCYSWWWVLNNNAPPCEERGGLSLYRSLAGEMAAARRAVRLWAQMGITRRRAAAAEAFDGS